MPRVVHFEISADDPERVVNFYKDAFGWNINKWEAPMDYWLVQTGKEAGAEQECSTDDEDRPAEGG